MTNRFMVSVAALTLIAGTGFANAQATKGESGGSTMQHAAPSNSAAAPSQSNSPSASSGAESSQPSKGEMKGDMKSSQTEQKSPSAMKNQRAEDNAKSGNTNQRAEERTKGADTNKSAEERTKGDETNMKAESRHDRNGTNTAETKGERSQSTTGQAGAGAKLTSDQRTRITTVIRNEHVTSVDHVNFSISVGTRVPRQGVELRPLPTEVVTVYPEWRGYEFIMVRNQILVVDPNTYEIVEVIES